MATTSPCSRCGTSLKTDVPGGLCLNCLLSFGLKDQTESAPDAASETEGPSSVPADLNAAEFTGYRVMEKLGEGGCGVVYRAEQIDPVQREVALKVIKLGMDSQTVIARFELERQSLALMEHPGIARVFSAGATRTGRPFFAMELVRGDRITDYCDHHRLSIPQRLELFAQVCEAVQHAHQKGVIHRDLKPSNILVTQIDGRAQPKIIDFGVAKATARQRLADHTVYTAFDQFVGTPAYMSPEQAGLTGEDVDTRSDIYSLGVLLYELLAGRPPFEPEQLRRVALNELCRIICEQDPARPSAHLTTLNEARLTEVARCRSAVPARLLRELRGDLDWIVLRALEKDRARRYETANALALEVRRHLNDEPVLARPPSGAYRLQKMIRRNRLACLAVAMVGVTLLAGALVSTWGFLREKEARQRAVVAETKATAQARRSDHVARLLKEVLAGAGPSVALGRDTTLLREILDRTVERLSHDLKDDPGVAAELRETIGRAYYDLRELKKAEGMQREALRLREQITGMTDSAVLPTLLELAIMLNTRAEKKDLIEAETLLRRALLLHQAESGRERIEIADALHILGWNLRSQNRQKESEPLYREALAVRERLLGAEDLGLVPLLNGLALGISGNRGQLDEAERLLLRSLEIQQSQGTGVTGQWIETLNVLGTVHRAQGRPAQAESMLREAIAHIKRLYGNEFETLIARFNDLALALDEQGKFAEAEQSIREAIALHRKLRSQDQPDLANFLLGTFVRVLRQQQKWAEAETAARERVTLLRPVSPDRLGALLDALYWLGDTLVAQKRWTETEAVLRESLELCGQPTESGRASSPSHCAKYRRMLGEALLRQGNYAEAEPHLLAANEGLQGKQGKAELWDFHQCMSHLVELYEATNRPAQAADWKQRLAEFEGRASGRD